MSIDDFKHTPVLANETMSVLMDANGGRVRRIVDCTLGCGGHSSLMLRRNPDAELLGIDRDDDALLRSSRTLEFASGRIRLVKGVFSDLENIVKDAGWDSVDAVLMDIGVSSPQIDDPERGFSFRFDGPLDMRMDQTSDLTAGRVLNRYSFDNLKRIFRDYGELDPRDAASLASAVVRVRDDHPFQGTLAFAEFCESYIHHVRRNGPPAATYVFQALRIEVNSELSELRKALESSEKILAPGGRIAVITFHSLEDRIVKNFFKDMAETCKCPPGLPICICGWKPKMKILTKHPVTPDSQEINTNIRSKCAKMRAAEKVQGEENEQMR